MLLYEDIEQELIKDEGERLIVYMDSRMIPTIGVGRNLKHKGISKDESRFMLQNDIEEAMKNLKEIFIAFDRFPDDVKLILINMYHALGCNGFRQFKKFILYMRTMDYKSASRELASSKWYQSTDTHKRVERLIMRLNNVE